MQVTTMFLECVRNTQLEACGLAHFRSDVKVWFNVYSRRSELGVANRLNDVFQLWIF